ncbi:pantoate--beta-alanine ligase [Azomonas macrocytogenes]|uniref:Pantothenate synthetase n=1 Tax=Azomonas macrocytogenes TaxID=69962 RepID=A0A839T902_AZOMA|nr:pantoate--beta-alanine ligase [Azomonas macrocytogenes]MBB3104936.1 pantoate--beta-alanine ligase [Azomonas macrocytogenes]
MKTINTISELRAAVAQARRENKRIGFVPTMGNLHSGHIALIGTALGEADFVVASIFVNPLQFGPHEDLNSYPRTLATDQEKLQTAGCHLLFAPNVNEMYPHGQADQTLVTVPGVSEGLCGGSRPGHFTGVATVVCKLFNMVQPDLAVFGQKDFQQLAVIRSMVRDLNLPIRIIGKATIRAEDGLALSSRNGYLTPEERQRAPALYATLKRMANQLRSGQRDYSTLIDSGLNELRTAGMRPDYLEIRDAQTLRPADANTVQLALLAAAYLGTTRLIDNLQVDLDAPS